MMLDDVLRRIDQKKAILDARRPLPAATLRTIQAALWLELTYNSNALEGNTLTIRETQVVLEGLTIGSGRTMREHLEVINHAAALDLLEDLAGRKEVLSPFIARQLHALILRGIDDANAGRERHVPVAISGSRHLPPSPHNVGPMLSDLFTWYRTTAMQLHPVQRAAALHHRFVYIHPFTDGNGRTARLLMNLDLMTFGYPPAIIRAEPKRRIEYLDSLETASIDGNLEPFEQVVAEAVEESLDRYLQWIGPTPRAQ